MTHEHVFWAHYRPGGTWPFAMLTVVYICSKCGESGHPIFASSQQARASPERSPPR